MNVEIVKCLNNSRSGAVDVSQSAAINDAVAVGCLDGGDIGGIRSASRQCSSEVAWICIKIIDGLNNFSGGAVDFLKS